MKCDNCKKEWTHQQGVSSINCPYCGKPLVAIQSNSKNEEPHEILWKIVKYYDKKILGQSLLKGIISDLMPHVEKKHKRIFKQALDDRIGLKLLELECEDNSVRLVKLSTLKNSFKNDNGFSDTADYVIDCFLYALGWIETIAEKKREGGEIIWHQDNLGYFTDSRDGNKYNWLRIGNQVWMAENLRYIPHVSPPHVQNGIWVYGYYGNMVAEAKDTYNYKNYGCLYDWETALKSCPSGWHIPSDQEWNVLVEFLGGDNNAGAKLKEEGTNHWTKPNEGALNSYGYSALPGGYRNGYDGSLRSIGEYGYWWSSTKGENPDAWYRYMGYNSAIIFRHGYYKTCGFNVRCIRDQK